MDDRGRGHAMYRHGRNDTNSHGTDGYGADGHGGVHILGNGFPIRLPWETNFQYYQRGLECGTPRNSFNYDTYVNDMRRSLDPDYALPILSGVISPPLLQENPSHLQSLNVHHLWQNENPFQYQQHQQSQNLGQFQQIENPFLYLNRDPVQYLQTQCHYQYQQNETAFPLELNQDHDHYQFLLSEDPLQHQQCQISNPLQQSENCFQQTESFENEVYNPILQEQSQNSDENQSPNNDQNPDQYDQFQISECATGANASSLYESIVSIVECIICFNTLIPPIFYCENGHNICGNCRKQVRFCPTCRAEFTSVRNFIVEEILMKILYPCKYKEQGCTALMLQEKKAQHEATCMFGCCECRVYVKDSVRCSWRGFRSALVSHIGDIHRRKVDTRNKCCTVLSADTEIKEDCSLKIIFGEMFWCHTKFDVNIGLLKTIQYIGPPENARYFEYSFYYALSMDGRSINYSNFVCTLDDNIDTLFDERKCFHITQESCTTMVKNGATKFLFDLTDIRQ